MRIKGTFRSNIMSSSSGILLYESEFKHVSQNRHLISSLRLCLHVRRPLAFADITDVKHTGLGVTSHTHSSAGGLP